MGVRQGKYVRSQIGPRIGYFYLALFVFTVLWYTVMVPQSARQGAMFFITIIMFAGTVIGIFSRSVSTIIGCVSLTLLAIVGYYLLPGYFYLWESIFGGLAMVAIGLTLRLRWR